MLVSRHNELEITETEIRGAMDLHKIGRDEAVSLLIGDPSEEERKHLQAKFPRLEYSNPVKVDRLIMTARLARSRWRGKALGFTDHVL